MDENLVTFSEIMEYTKFSHNTVSKKIKRLGIQPVGISEGKGRTKLYSREDMEKIKAYNPIPYRPGTIFYRVSIRVGYCWIVTAAGLSISRAKKAVEDYKKNRITARYTPCS